MHPTAKWIVPALILLCLADCPSHEGGDPAPADPERAHGGEPPQRAEAATAAPAVQETAVSGRARDPVCGMIVAIAGQPEAVYRDTRFHFCAAACLAKFEAAPGEAVTGLPDEACPCSLDEGSGCRCAHCMDAAERCDCGDPLDDEPGEDPGDPLHGSHEAEPTGR